tara:strand:- start:81 stop:575 length:495 start_codon:yes stop_codon:yes gene_type:complete
MYNKGTASNTGKGYIYSMVKMHITGARRGLGKALADKYGNVSLDECDVFINCKHDGFSQIDLLYIASEKGKRIVNIGSNSPDEQKKVPHRYAIIKGALDKANDQLFYQGVDTTILRFGYFDSPRVSHINTNKMSIDYCVYIVEWVLDQPHRVKDITVSPRKENR